MAIGLGLLGAAVLTALPCRAPTESYIVQGASLANARAAVEALGGEITHELGTIHGTPCTTTARDGTYMPMHEVCCKTVIIVKTASREAVHS